MSVLKNTTPLFLGNFVLILCPCDGVNQSAWLRAGCFGGHFETNVLASEVGEPNLDSRTPVLLFFLLVWWKTRTRNSIGSQEFISHYVLEYITKKPGKKFKAGASKQRPWWNAADWFPPRGLFILLSYTTQDRLPRGGIIRSRQRPRTFIISQENGPQTFLQSKLIGQFSHLTFSLPRWLLLWSS